MSRFGLCLLIVWGTAGLLQARSLTWIGGPWAYFKGVTPPSSDDSNAWKTVEFDDSSWPRSAMGFSAGVHQEATPLVDLAGQYRSLFLRRRFAITNKANIGWLWLRLRVASGAAVYLNGEELYRTNLPGTPGEFVPFDTAATAPGETGLIVADVSHGLSALREGENVLALQVHTSGPESPDLLCLAELMGNFTRGPVVANVGPTSAIVAWSCGTPVEGRVRYGTDLGNDSHLTPEGPVATDFVRRLEGLEPGTAYRYRVECASGSRSGRSAELVFRTPTTSGPVRFAVLGDTGAGSVGQYGVATGLAASEPDFVLHTGDIVYPAMSRDRIDFRCLSVYQPLMSRAPFYFTFGNHDLYSGSDGPFLDSFVLPTNSVSGTPHYYSFDVGDVHFVSCFVPTLTEFSQAPAHRLAPDSAHYRWLTNDLAMTDRPWKVLFFHSPMNTSALHRTDDYDGDGHPDRFQIQATIQPVLERYGVQVVFNGHDHGYERFRPTNGVHVIVTGGGGAPLYGLAEKDANSGWFQAVHHHVVAEVDNDLMKIRAVSIDGTLLDSATIPRTPPMPGLDSDGDGLGDAEELVAGTDPHDPKSTVRLETSSQSGAHVLRWKTTPGRHYELLVATNSPAGFAPLDGQPPRTAQQDGTDAVDAGSTNAPRFFRLRVGP